jgi:two-component system cell cycle sensor histidine kinase/response regulator CckA
MPRGGAIAIRARSLSRGESFAFGVIPEPEKFAYITVEDTGGGMPDDVLRNAFDPLFTTKQNGTGLGLAVAHHVVEKHGGSIFVESAVGVGTTFHIFLPRAEDVAHEVAREADGREDSCVRARRILIVEDEPSISEGLAVTLRDYGIESTVVDTGGLAVDAARQFGAEAAVIDIWLPDIDGIEVGMRLRALDPKLKIVFVSGHGNASHALAECAPATFLQKPFAIGELLAAIASLEV